MATENQIRALEKWLNVHLLDMHFKKASAYLDRLHDASEMYKKDKKANKGIIKKVKAEIIAELQELGLVVDEKAVQAGLNEGKEKVTSGTLAGVTQPEKNGETEIEGAVTKLGMIMRYSVREATAIVEQEISSSGISEAAKAGILQRIATTIFIQGGKMGL